MKLQQSKPKNQLAVYQAKNGAIELRADFNMETIWATQADIVKLFDKDQSVISRHIANIFKDEEIDKKRNMQKMHIANSDKPVIYYSLDVVLAIGYRTNSNNAIEFRKWATKILRQHITQGYTINPIVIKNNYAQFLEAIDNVKKLLPSDSQIKSGDTLELIKMFASTWFSLEAYDTESLPMVGVTKKQVKINTDHIARALKDLKQTLTLQKEASEFFGQEKTSGSLSGIIGNIFQTFAKQDVYSTQEEKAAHLLYFMVKDHPFIDGNKRSGAFVFVWFLQKAKILNTRRLTPEALTALTLLIAESNPKDKSRMIGLILMLLKK